MATPCNAAGSWMGSLLGGFAIKEVIETVADI